MLDLCLIVIDVVFDIVLWCYLERALFVVASRIFFFFMFCNQDIKSWTAQNFLLPDENKSVHSTSHLSFQILDALSPCSHIQFAVLCHIKFS